jgi:hypothetical protein
VPAVASLVDPTFSLYGRAFYYIAMEAERETNVYSCKTTPKTPFHNALSLQITHCFYPQSPTLCH